MMVSCVELLATTLVMEGAGGPVVVEGLIYYIPLITGAHSKKQWCW